jgi:hypothetical protein
MNGESPGQAIPDQLELHRIAPGQNWRGYSNLDLMVS